jgi:hypothetical protein
MFAQLENSLSLLNTNLVSGLEQAETTTSSAFQTLNKFNPLQFTDLNKNEKDDATDFAEIVADYYNKSKTIGGLLMLPLALYASFTIGNSVVKRLRRNRF